MIEYTVPMQFVFTGKFFIKAESQKQANEYAMKHCGLVLGGDIHSTLPDDDVNWDFVAHPQQLLEG